MSRTTYSVRFDPEPAGPVLKVATILVLLVFAFGVWAAATNPWGFDGMVGPGCDWGNSNCTRGDYRENCRGYDGSVRDARYVHWCKGRNW